MDDAARATVLNARWGLDDPDVDSARSIETLQGESLRCGGAG